MDAPFFAVKKVTLFHGDCRKARLPKKSVHAVVTSPPYATQRAKFYNSISEEDFPAFTVRWMRRLRPSLADGASVFINIREHIRNGVMSDYVHRTRLALREDGWDEVDELIWNKPSSAPVGRINRPRRSWERVLWFAQDGASVRCFPKANGSMSRRIGMVGTVTNKDVLSDAALSTVRAGVSRCTDVATFSTSRERGIKHPAMFPVELAAWLIRLSTERGDTVCDPFNGSGSTAIAALQERRHYVGIELERSYCKLTRKRVRQHLKQKAYR